MMHKIHGIQITDGTSLLLVSLDQLTCITPTEWPEHRVPMKASPTVAPSKSIALKDKEWKDKKPFEYELWETHISLSLREAWFGYEMTGHIKMKPALQGLVQCQTLTCSTITNMVCGWKDSFLWRWRTLMIQGVSSGKPKALSNTCLFVLSRPTEAIEPHWFFPLFDLHFTWFSVQAWYVNLK